ncbi:MAG: hypothetical protein EXS39_07400 [Opitutaceae bacterium]|nr:hypothetical protein [Opitutaceae bacterium]
MASATYLETFDQDTAGWYGWGGNHKGYEPLIWEKGSVTSRGPWWVDYNHAPPGAGYLHMVFSLNTRGPFSDHHREVARENPFAANRLPLDFRNARISLRFRGELETRGAELVLLIQGRLGATTSGWLLTGQPFKVKNDWTEQTVVAVEDKAQWTCLGSRHDRQDYYSFHPLESVLKDVNTNIMLVLFPLNVQPMGPIPGDPHRLRAGRDYPLWTSRLPDGYVQLGTVKIEFAR